MAKIMHFKRDINRKWDATEQCRVARKERKNPLRKRDVLSNGCESRPAKTKLSQPVARLASVIQPAMAQTMRSQANT